VIIAEIRQHKTKIHFKMITINIKPLSVNECWQGKRFKTPKYKAFEKELLLKLKPKHVPKGKLLLTVFWGLSSKNADWDNPIKPFQDVIQKKFGFNDRWIYRGEIEKLDVPKGQEFIKFELTKL